ncbi:MAG: hypothetical protein BZ135_02275 [Methanosphaera sp. rholeuAM6]|nr:MAG: hypothetical protein BZ135_02275 [Methanosphaera sp. rholeuAM6]
MDKDNFKINYVSNSNGKIGKDEIYDIVNNITFYEDLQQDNGTLADHNDCWSNLEFFSRENEYTRLSNKSDDIALPFLLNEEDDRLILPDKRFVLEFKYIENFNSTLRFANLKEKYINIDIYDLHLSPNDMVKIEYNSGDISIYQNNKLIDKKYFVINNNHGYITWRLPQGAYIKFSNFRLYTQETSFKEMINDYVGLSNECSILSNRLDSLEKRYKDFETDSKKRLEASNFLFNNLYLDYDLKAKGILKDMQLLCIELLEFVNNICKKYGLEWWLDYGNLLGAVRHNNFIPWDDDVDIGMMRKDYDKFNSVLKKEIAMNGLSDLLSVSYRKRTIDKNKVNAFIQIFIMHRTENHGNTIFAGVDIFPYDYLEDYDKDNLDDVYEDVKNKFYRSLVDGPDFKKIYMGKDSQTILKDYYNNLNLKMDKAHYIIPGVEGSCGPHNLYKLMVLDYDTVFPLKEIQYDEKVFPCPNNCDEYLKSIYGEYMNIPPKIRTHGRANRFRYYFGIDETFKEDCKLLKDINNNFK